MWRSFSRVPHLLQYASSGTYFARIKVRGKIIRDPVPIRHREKSGLPQRCCHKSSAGRLGCEPWNLHEDRKMLGL
jgi:hypothetical protein